MNIDWKLSHLGPFDLEVEVSALGLTWKPEIWGAGLDPELGGNSLAPGLHSLYYLPAFLSSFFLNFRN